MHVGIIACVFRLSGWKYVCGQGDFRAVSVNGLHHDFYFESDWSDVSACTSGERHDWVPGLACGTGLNCRVCSGIHEHERASCGSKRRLSKNALSCRCGMCLFDQMEEPLVFHESTAHVGF